jgi:hypothetical protein
MLKTLKLQLKRWLRKPLVSVRFCYHNYKSFRVGRFPLVACYCSKCGKVKYGNSIYYDGSTYQKNYKGENAIDFVKEKAEYLRNRDKSFAEIKQNIGLDLFDSNEYILRQNYETIEEYDRIVVVLLNAR